MRKVVGFSRLIGRIRLSNAQVLQNQSSNYEMLFTNVKGNNSRKLL